MGTSTRQFRKIMATFATGVTVVSTRNSDGRPYGVTVNAFCSVSLDPMLVLVCLDNRLSGLDSFRKFGFFAVHLLRQDQAEISNYFATRGTNRSRFLTGEGKESLPILERSLARIECRLSESHLAGDHTILVGEVIHLEMEATTDSPLLYFQGRYRQLAEPIEKH